MQNNGVLDACKELGVRVLAYSPLGKGALTGRFKNASDFKGDGDLRGSGLFPRFTEGVFEQNLKLVHGGPPVTCSAHSASS